MKTQLLLTGLGALTLAGCATDGRNPHVGVGVSVGGSAPPPVIAEAPRGGSPPWALARYKLRSAPIQLLVTDVVMPEMSGRELAERLPGQWPSIKVLYLSSFLDDAVLLHGPLRAEHTFLQKPFSSSALASRVQRELDSPDMHAGETASPQPGPSRESREVHCTNEA